MPKIRSRVEFILADQFGRKKEVWLGRFWDVFINVLIEITIKSGSPLLYWALFDVVGLVLFSVLLSMIAFDLCCFVKYRPVKWFDKNTIISFIFISAILVCFVFCILITAMGPCDM